jgi:recombination protein RecT
MSIQKLREATGTSLQVEGKKAFTFPEMLTQFKDQIALALPKHLNPDRMARVALTEFRKNPALAECDPKTIFASIIVASQLGLEPGVMGQAYLIPYGKQCQLVPGWQGYVDLVSRAGRATVRTGVVRPGDHFSYDMGTAVNIVHTVTDKTDYEAPFTHVYAIGKVRGAEEPNIEVWTNKQVEAHLKRYNKVGNRHYAKQNSHNLEMYGRKVVLLQVIKYLPKSVELQTAAGLDYSAEVGQQNISIDEAVSNTFVPAGYEHEPATLEGEKLTSENMDSEPVLGWDEK